jgi:very-short-patch-repair endonuclease
MPEEAGMLYYGLKQAGIKPMLAWWDGKKTVDLAISRVKLNIEIDQGYESLSHQQAMNDLEETMHSFRNGFTTIRIPHFLIRNHLGETVNNILGIMDGLKANIKVV